MKKDNIDDKDKKTINKKESKDKKEVKVVNKKDIKDTSKKETKKVEKKLVNKEDKVILKEKTKENNENIIKVKETEKESSFIDKNVEFNLLEVIIIVLITGVFVCVVSSIIVYYNYDKLNSTVNNYTSNSSSDLKELEENYNTIINNYVNEVNKEELIDAAISGMYNYLDDSNTFYIDKNNNDTLQDTLTGEYEGIGVEITTSYNKDGSFSTYISRLFQDSAAMKAGLQVGDVFIELNGVDLTDKDSSYVANVIKNGAQTENTIKVLRDGKEITLTIKREHIYIDSVHSEVKDGVGYIQLETFSLTTADQVKKAIDSFDENIKSLVIDLRDNGGGYTVSAYDTANLFVEKGKNIYQIKDKDNKITEYKADAGVYRKFDNIAVLVNGSSASSSEILALALKESANAIIVGTKSYGKGSVQETKQLSSGAMVKYTIAYWLSPNGNSINEIGITPDKMVEEEDNQITEAIKAVK